MVKERNSVAAKKGSAKAARLKTKPRGGATRQSLVSLAYEEIKEKIITLHFLPGQYLNEGAISSLLGLGRTPVHQALQRLQVDGLVEVMPRKGVIVLPDSIAEIIRILDARATVEAELARNAAERATPEQAQELLALARESKISRDDPNIDLFTSRDRDFHSKIADLAGNPLLGDFARRMHERSTRFWYLHLWQTIDPEATGHQHKAIADAISAGDAKAADRAMREHINNLKARLSQLQRRHGEHGLPRQIVPLPKGKIGDENASQQPRRK